MTTIPTKKEFIAKNWEGPDRWRRIELNELAIKLNLELLEKDSNRDVFERILLEFIRQKKKRILKKEMLSDNRIAKLYKNFMEQLPEEKSCGDIDIDYEFFLRHNQDHFFMQTKQSFDFLEYFLENQIYYMNQSDWKAFYVDYIFFNGDGKYLIAHID